MVDAGLEPTYKEKLRITPGRSLPFGLFVLLFVSDLEPVLTPDDDSFDLNNSNIVVCMIQSFMHY